MLDDNLLDLEHNELSYPRLDLSSNSFRLLALQPDLDPDSIPRFQLFTAQQADFKKRYIACSYTWGPPVPLRAVLVNGSFHLVRQNCYDLLQACRTKSGPPSILWVDALCINQGSKSEKNHQVAQMGNIYGQARMVYSWLGLGKPDVEWLFEKLNSKYSSGSSPFVRQPSNILNKMLAASTLVAFMEYWTRLWVVQEVVCAQDIMILYGKKRLPWQSLADHFNSLNAMMGGVLDPPVLLQMGTMRENRASRSLENLFYTFGHMSCELPLDKVYALYGMQREPKLQHALVDYNQDPWNLLCELIRQCCLVGPLEFVYTFVRHLGLNAGRGMPVLPRHAKFRKIQIPLREPEIFECLYPHSRSQEDCTWKDSCRCLAQSGAFADKRTGAKIAVYASKTRLPHVLLGFKISGRSAPAEYLLVDAVFASEDTSTSKSSPAIGIGSRNTMHLPSSCSNYEHKYFSECIKKLPLTSTMRTNHENGEHVLETNLSAFVSLTFNFALRPRETNCDHVLRGQGWGAIFM